MKVSFRRAEAGRGSTPSGDDPAGEVGDGQATGGPRFGGGFSVFFYPMLVNLVYASLYGILTFLATRSPEWGVLAGFIAFRLETLADGFGIIVRSQLGQTYIDESRWNAERQIILNQYEGAVADIANNN